MRFYVFNILRTIFARVITFILPELRRIHVQNLCIFPPVSLTICTFFFLGNIELLKNLLLTKKCKSACTEKSMQIYGFRPLFLRLSRQKIRKRPPLADVSFLSHFLVRRAAGWRSRKSAFQDKPLTDRRSWPPDRTG